MVKIEFDATIRTVLEQDRHKEDLDQELGKITVRNSEGNKQAIITVPKAAVKGFKAGSTVRVLLVDDQTKL